MSYIPPTFEGTPVMPPPETERPKPEPVATAVEREPAPAEIFETFQQQADGIMREVNEYIEAHPESKDELWSAIDSLEGHQKMVEKLCKGGDWASISDISGILGAMRAIRVGYIERPEMTQVHPESVFAEGEAPREEIGEAETTSEQVAEVTPVVEPSVESPGEMASEKETEVVRLSADVAAWQSALDQITQSQPYTSADLGHVDVMAGARVQLDNISSALSQGQVDQRQLGELEKSLGAVTYALKAKYNGEYGHLFPKSEGESMLGADHTPAPSTETTRPAEEVSAFFEPTVDDEATHEPSFFGVEESAAVVEENGIAIPRAPAGEEVSSAEEVSDVTKTTETTDVPAVEDTTGTAEEAVETFDTESEPSQPMFLGIIMPADNARSFEIGEFKDALEAKRQRIDKILTPEQQSLLDEAIASATNATKNGFTPNDLDFFHSIGDKLELTEEQREKSQLLSQLGGMSHARAAMIKFGGAIDEVAKRDAAPEGNVPAGETA